jgi:hypothetical protein
MTKTKKEKITGVIMLFVLSFLSIGLGLLLTRYQDIDNFGKSISTPEASEMLSPAHEKPSGEHRVRQMEIWINDSGQEIADKSDGTLKDTNQATLDDGSRVLVQSDFQPEQIQSSTIQGSVDSSRIAVTQTSSTTKITSCQELQNMNLAVAPNYELANDIDCSETKNWNCNAPTGICKGFDPIDNPSLNIFDGKGHLIRNLYINRSDEDYIGLFGNIGGRLIKNLGLVNVNIIGRNNVGSFFGANGYIRSSFVSGNIRGYNRVGGIMPYTSGCGNWIADSYSNANVTGKSLVGGLVGYLDKGYILNSYSTGNISLDCYGNTTRCYDLGGLVGEVRFAKCGYDSDIDIGPRVENSFFSGRGRELSYNSFSALTGFIDYSMQIQLEYNFYYFKFASWVNPGPNNAFLESHGITDESYFNGDVSSREPFINWDFESTWLETDSFPILRWQTEGLKQQVCPLGMAGDGTENNPCQITTCEQLQSINDARFFDYKLMNNIDCSATKTWNNGEGFYPIGSNCHISAYNECPIPQTGPFTGKFDGNGYSISGLYINRINEGDVALFGYAKNAEISNLNIVSANIYGYFAVGILGGYIYNSAIDSVYTEGTISNADSEDVGGIIGYLERSTLTNSHARINIAGVEYIGGLAGSVGESTIDSCYAEGIITSTLIEAGGLAGYVFDSKIINSHSNADVSGAYYIGGLFGYIGTSNISGSYSSSNISGDSEIGGLIGYGSNIIINNSYSNSQISGTDYVGGLAGFIEHSSSRQFNPFYNSNFSGTLNCTTQNFGNLFGNSVCLDHILDETKGEVCDNDFFKNKCSDFGDFDDRQGELTCSDDCKSVSTEDCQTWCWNDELNPEKGEVCEYLNGQDYFQNWTCNSFGFAQGNLYCSDNCDSISTRQCYDSQCIIPGMTEPYPIPFSIYPSAPLIAGFIFNYSRYFSNADFCEYSFQGSNISSKIEVIWEGGYIPPDPGEDPLITDIYYAYEKTITNNNAQNWYIALNSSGACRREFGIFPGISGYLTFRVKKDNKTYYSPTYNFNRFPDGGTDWVSYPRIYSYPSCLSSDTLVYNYRDYSAVDLSNICTTNLITKYSDWTSGSCSTSDLRTQTRTKTIYDANNCSLVNTTTTETRTVSCDYCTPEWKCSSYDSCQPNDKKPCLDKLDANNCYAQTGLNSDQYTGDLSELFGYCDLGNDGILGSISDVTTNIANLTLNQDGDKFSFEKNNETFVEFDFDISKSNLTLLGVSLQKQNPSDTKGYILLKGLNLTSQNSTKTVYMDRIDTTSNRVCILDDEVLIISQISSTCTSSGEVSLTCDGTKQGDYTCTLLNNSRYKIEGLRHSATIEYTYTTQTTTTNGGSGGSGGGGSRKTYQCNDKKDNDNDGLIDLNDPGCTDKNDDDEYNYICKEKWVCTNWEPAVCPAEQTQTRTCEDVNRCGTQAYKEPTVKYCKHNEPVQDVQEAKQTTQEQPQQIKTSSQKAKGWFLYVFVGTILIIAMLGIGYVFYPQISDIFQPKSMADFRQQPTQKIFSQQREIQTQQLSFNPASVKRLEIYARKMMSEGYPRDKIREAILKVGWKQDIVDYVFARIK